MKVKTDLGNNFIICNNLLFNINSELLDVRIESEMLLIIT